jgi:hypothetical protein
MKPVLQFAAVEHQLHSADADAQRQKAENVEILAMHVPAVADERQDADHAEQPDRQVDVENPAPAEILGQITAQQRPADRPHDRADAVDRHRVAVAFRRIDRQQRRL